jgi:hypothetical protein
MYPGDEFEYRTGIRCVEELFARGVFSILSGRGMISIESPPDME